MRAVLQSRAILAAVLIAACSSIVCAQKLPTHARRTLWVSPTASTAAMMSREGVVELIEQAKRAGFDAIILYVKELDGRVIYPSRNAPRLTEHKGTRFDINFDPLQTFIEEAHRRGLLLHAGFETFSEGNKQFPGTGVGYTKYKDWQTVAYDVDEADRQIKRVPWGDFKQGVPLFVNAALPAVQDYELSVVREVLQRYDVDAVVFDRARWQGINADFSDYSRELFKKYVRDARLRWPEDVYEIRLRDGKKEIVEGKYYKQWLEWRAHIIHDYFARLNQLVRKVKPRVSLEDYVGSWYPVYNEVGVNWARDKYEVPYRWATPGYGKTGYAQFLDVLYVGLYYPHVTEAEAVAAGAPAWRSVEGAARLARAVTMGATSVQGVINYGDDNLSADELERATEVAARELDGASIFEVSHVRRRQMWPLLTKCFNANAKEKGRK